MIEFISKIAIVDSNPSLESESDHNRGSNLDRHFDSMTTIRFGTSNRFSLNQTQAYSGVPTHRYIKNFIELKS